MSGSRVCFLQINVLPLLVMKVLRTQEYTPPVVEDLYVGPEAQILDFSTITIEDGELEDWGTI